MYSDIFLLRFERKKTPTVTHRERYQKE